MNEVELKQALLDLEQKEYDLAARRKELRHSGIETVQNIVDRLGLRSDDIRWPSVTGLPAEPAKKSRGTVPPKYRGPDGELWTGRGRKPRWAQEILDKGGDIEAFLIK